MHFEVIGDIEGIELIAAGPSVRVVDRLKKAYGGSRWRKLKGTPECGCQTTASAGPSFTGLRRTESVERK